MSNSSFNLNKNYSSLESSNLSLTDALAVTDLVIDSLTDQNLFFEPPSLEKLSPKGFVSSVNSDHEELNSLPQIPEQTQIYPVLANSLSQAINSSSVNTIVISPSGDYQIDGILSADKWNLSATNNTLTYSFYEDTVFQGSYYGNETGVREVSEGVKSNVRTILGGISNFININFQEVQETANNYGVLRFMLSNSPSYAYAYYPFESDIGGDVHLNANNDVLNNGNGFQNPAGFHGYMTLIHEIGHSLGLKHPHEDSPTLPTQDDNTTNTVMTYNLTGDSAGTLMPYDIKALQYLYGAKSYNAGNTNYQFTERVDQYNVDNQLFLNTSETTKLTIWDSGGVDTLDFSNLSTNNTGYHFDLTSGGILTTKDAYNNTSYSNGYQTTTYGTAIAYNVLVENLVNSSSNDDIYLNTATNIISGYNRRRFSGGDVIWNATNQDILDLSQYSATTVSQTQSGNDLILSLQSNGTITLKDYYAGHNLNILFSTNNNDQLINPVYRFYNPISKGHFFTTNTAERDTVLANPQWQYTFEGVGFYASQAAGDNLLPVYRFYNPISKGHFFTTNTAERDTVLANPQWQYTFEGVGFYTYGSDSNLGLDIYRFYNPISKGHFFTINPTEKDTVLANPQWQYTFEGVGFEAI